MFLKMFENVAEVIAAILTLETLKESPTILKTMRASRLWSEYSIYLGGLFRQPMRGRLKGRSTNEKKGNYEECLGEHWELVGEFVEANKKLITLAKI